MTSRPDDWDEPAQDDSGDTTPPHPPHLPGYRDASAAPKPRRVVAPVPSCGAVLAAVEESVEQSCRRPDVDLDLPEAVAASVYLLKQSYYLAHTAWAMERRDQDRRGWAQVSGLDLREDFGPHLEATILGHADLLLSTWYARQRSW